MALRRTAFLLDVLHTSCCSSWASGPLCLKYLAPASSQWFHSFNREWFGDSSSSAETRMEASQLLESINALHLRKTLDYLAEEQVHTTYRDLLNLAQESGAGITPAKAEELCKALVTAGVVLRYKDVVYLRPDEISEMVLTNLPHRQADVERKLEQLKKELAPLMATKAEIKKQAIGKSSMYLSAGLMFLMAQFGIFFWLTFYELSWDVIEPVAYFFSLGYGILTYVYFLVQRQDFDYLGFRRKLESDHETKVERAKQFDEDKFKKLTRAIENYEKYLARFSAEQK